MTEKEIYQAAVDTFGDESQIDMLIEEMSEVTKALLKLRRVQKRKVVTLPDALSYEQDLNKAFDNVHDELADLGIVYEQMKLIFDANKVEIYKGIKIARLEYRIITNIS